MADTNGTIVDALWTLLDSSAARDPGRIALMAPGREALTYAGLCEVVSEVAGRLAALGLGSGDRVALVLDPGPELASTFLGVAASATCAPLNPSYGTRELEFYLSDLKARAVVVPEGSAADAPAVAVARSLGLSVLEVGPGGEEAGRLALGAGWPSVGSAPRWSNAGEVALTLHTSGTTARPKLVPLSQANLVASALNVAATLALGPGDRCLNVMPLFHIHGLVAGLLASLSAGASVVCCPGFAAPDFFGWLDECEPTWYTAVPTIHQAVLGRVDRHRDVVERRRLRLIRSSSAPLPPRVMAELETAFGAPVIEAYGMTEAAHQMASNPLPPGERKAGTVGRAAGPELAVVDDEGRPLPVGSVGEVVVRGPNVTAGYEANPEANRTGFFGDWFRTGDQGYLDADGYLTLTGRLKELINRGGEKVAPREVDEALLDHPAVAQALAFAAPHLVLGEEVAAAVVLRPGSSATAAELREHVARQLTYFKVPSRFVFLDEIPKGPTGKPQRVGLAQTLGLNLDAAGTDVAPPVTPPRDELEAAIAEIWAEVLGLDLDRVGAHQGFLEVGGDSLTAARVLGRLRDALGVEVALVDLFAAPTVAGLAEAVRCAMAALPENEAARLLDEVVEDTP
ncbi:MAG: AMP-binding protein [Isosphaeraceae bacterium]